MESIKKCIDACKKCKYLFRMNESHPCFIACDDCLHVCEFVNKHKLLNPILDNLSLQLCIRACKHCIKECKKHADEHRQCANCVEACQECIDWCAEELTN